MKIISAFQTNKKISEDKNQILVLRSMKSLGAFRVCRFVGLSRKYHVNKVCDFCESSDVQP